MDGVLEWVAIYGYGALFFLLMTGIIGLPVPDETLLVFCGYLVSQGKMHPAGTYLAAAAGSLCGITVSYTLGRTVGIGVVHRFGKYFRVTDAQLERVHRWFERSGHWALFGGYYIAGVRHFTAVIAGASKLEFRVFALFAWSGGLLWVASFLTLGYVIGENWRRASDLVHASMHTLAYILVAVALAYLLGRYWRIKWLSRKE